MRNSGSDQVRLTGQIHPVDYFRVVERDLLDRQVWTDLLRERPPARSFARYRNRTSATAFGGTSGAASCSGARSTPSGARTAFPGSELLYWNISPDRESRHAFGTSTDIYGYPNVQAVAPCGGDGVFRTTVNLLMGELDEERTLY